MTRSSSNSRRTRAHSKNEAKWVAPPRRPTTQFTRQRLSQPKDLETERGGSAGLDVVVG